jgi:hypothetical protein
LGGGRKIAAFLLYRRKHRLPLEKDNPADVAKKLDDMVKKSFAKYPSKK